MGVILLWVGVFPRESLNPVRVALIPGKFPGIMFAGWLPQARARGMADLKTVFDPKKGADELATTDTGLDEIEELRPRMRRCQIKCWSQNGSTRRKNVKEVRQIARGRIGRRPRYALKNKGRL
eukprot:SAG25_NODE_1832_length_2280_cov_131.016506_1_plen_123_part_00